MNSQAIGILKIMPSLSQQLKDIIASQRLTLYGAAQLVGAEWDDNTPIKTIHQRLRRLTSDRPPESIEQLEAIAHALGYELVLTPKE